MIKEAKEQELLLFENAFELFNTSFVEILKSNLSIFKSPDSSSDLTLFSTFISFSISSIKSSELSSSLFDIILICVFICYFYLVFSRDL